MADRKIFAGAAVRRLRRNSALTQLAMADMLAISPSYLNLIERNQRPLTAALLLRLADQFDVDPRQFAGEDMSALGDAVRRRLADPLFADLEVSRTDIDEWLAAAPTTAEAFARAFDRGSSSGGGPAASTGPVDAARGEIERWRGHFADLDMAAETLADELRLGAGDLYGAIAERLRVNHALTIRILPVEVMPDALRRTDLHARQLQLSELLDPASRTFSAAYQLAQIEAKGMIDALVRGAGFTDKAADRMYRRHLTSYFAAALMMPYARFLRACEATGYDVELLQRRFGAGFEQVAHRLTTLQRVGQRGLPFFLIRIDRSGQASKRFAGASASPLVETDGRCPLWDIHEAFAQPGRLITDLVELEDGGRWFTMARTTAPQGSRIGGVRAQFVVGLGLAADLAAPLAAARGLDLKRGEARAIGLGCVACTRADCPQRAAPPATRALRFNDRERGLSPFAFVGD